MRDHLTILMSTYRQIRRRRRQAQPSQTTSTDSTPATPNAAPPCELRTERVDDPFGRNTIIALRGPICRETLDALTDDSPSWGERTYLDFRHARIPNRRAVERLELWFERLEARGVHIHVSGINPEHPALRV